MHFNCVDLQKRVFSACVFSASGPEWPTNVESSLAAVYAADQSQQIRKFFAGLEPFQFVIEATSSYEWLVQP